MEHRVLRSPHAPSDPPCCESEMSASTRVTWNASQNAESFMGLHIWGFTWAGQRSVIRKEAAVVNYSCIPGREPQYSSWVPTALYLLGLNTLTLTLMGGVLGGGGRGSPITTRKYFQVSTLCVCVCVCRCLCMCTHMCICALSQVWAGLHAH